jgi:hypothetical protein
MQKEALPPKKRLQSRAHLRRSYEGRGRGGAIRGERRKWWPDTPPPSSSALASRRIPPRPGFGRQIMEA